MEFTFRLLGEHAELTSENAMLQWQIRNYEILLNELMDYVCDQDALGEQYIQKYQKIREIKRGSVK